MYTALRFYGGFATCHGAYAAARHKGFAAARHKGFAAARHKGFAACHSVRGWAVFFRGVWHARGGQKLK
jgi:hypothetical protein